MSVPNQLFSDWLPGDTMTAEKLNKMKNMVAALAGANFTGPIQVNGDTVWHEGNDGAGSGLDADTLHGIEPDAIALFHAVNANPLATSDETLGFQAGHWWLNTSTNTLFVCLDATTGSAEWVWVFRPLPVTRVLTEDHTLEAGDVGRHLVAVNELDVRLPDGLPDGFWCWVAHHADPGENVVLLPIEGTVLVSAYGHSHVLPVGSVRMVRGAGNEWFAYGDLEGGSVSS